MVCGMPVLLNDLQSAHIPAKACPGPDPGWPPVRRQEYAPS